jgi:hypothetical protein
VGVQSRRLWEIDLSCDHPDGCDEKVSITDVQFYQGLHKALEDKRGGFSIPEYESATEDLGPGAINGFKVYCKRHKPA